MGWIGVSQSVQSVVEEAEVVSKLSYSRENSEL